MAGPLSPSCRLPREKGTVPGRPREKGTVPILLPIACLVLALAAAVGGFTMLALGEPEVDIAVHRARVAGDEDAAAELEGRLERRRWARRTVIAGLFVSAVGLGAAGFVVMKPERRPSRKE